MLKMRRFRLNLDIIISIIQAVALALVACFELTYLLYILIGLLNILYQLERERILDLYVSKKGVDLDKFMGENYFKIYSEMIIPDIIFIHEHPEPDNTFDRVNIFLKWKEASELIINNKIESYINNEPSSEYVKTNIYRIQFEATLEALINVYEQNNCFEDIIDSFSCSTLKGNCKDLYNDLKVMKNNL